MDFGNSNADELFLNLHDKHYKAFQIEDTALIILRGVLMDSLRSIAPTIASALGGTLAGLLEAEKSFRELRGHADLKILINSLRPATQQLKKVE